MTGSAITETWHCDGVDYEVRVDESGCPIDRKFCKTQAGGEVLGVLTTAAFTITINVNNFSAARVKGLVMTAVDPATSLAVPLDAIELTSIDIQGTEQLGAGPVSAARYAADAQGDREGTGQQFNGEIGSGGGAMTLLGVNNSALTVDIMATIDINGVRPS